MKCEAESHLVLAWAMHMIERDTGLGKGDFRSSVTYTMVSFAPTKMVTFALAKAKSICWNRNVVQKEPAMKKIFLVVVISMFAAGSALAQSCESKAVSKDGKPLSGAAKTSFVKKCKQDACEPKAIGKDGKPLSGAAKNSFMAKCEKET